MADEQTKPDVKPARGRWVTPLLILSLAINIAVAGLVVGAVFGDKRPDRYSGPVAGGMRPFLSALPEDVRPMVRQKLYQNRELVKTSRKQLRASSQAVKQAIGADPFDVEVLKQAFAGQRGIYDDLARNSHNALADIIATMSAQERADYLTALAKYKRRPGSDGGKEPKK